MKRYFLVLISLVLLASIAKADDPAGVAHKLLTVARDNFGFSLASVHAEKACVTPALYARMLKKVNEPTPKGDAPDIEGDLFFNSQETPTGFKVGAAQIDGTQARVPVTVQLPGETWHCTMLLRQVDGAWKVDDVDYGKDGKLTDQLKPAPGH